MRPTTTLVLAFLSAAAPAQTYVVDANNGPGTHFTSLATATTTVADGSVLQVRQGSYAPPVVIQGKSLTVLCDAGVEVHSQFGNPTSLAIDGIAANQTVVVRGLQLFAPTFHTQTSVHCTNSSGLILLDGVRPSPLNNSRTDFEASGCTTICLRGCAFVGRTTVTNCQMVMVGCTIPAPGNLQQNGIAQNGGALQLVDCTVRGATTVSVPGGPAVGMNGGGLRLLGTTTLTGGSSGFGGPSGFAVGGTGNVRRDPRATLVGGTPLVAPTVSLTTVSMPRVTVEDVLPAGTVRGLLHGPLGHGGFLFVSLTGQAIAVPFLDDPVWLDVPGMLILAAGVPGTGAPVTGSIFVPTSSVALGFKFAWQGLSFDPASGLQTSNPEYTVVQ